MADRGDLHVACTAVMFGQLSLAGVAAERYLRHHPGHEFVVLVLDRASVPEAAAGYRVVGYDWLDVDRVEYLRLATCGGAERFADVVLPLLVRHLLDRYSSVLALSPRVLTLRPFGEVAELALEHGMVLTPMVLTPLPDDGLNPGASVGTELAGFDPGFIAVGRSGREFVDFWARRTRESLLDSPFPSISSVLPVHRQWLDDVPALFAPWVLRDPAFGVAYWNLHERDLNEARYLHLAGYSPEQPWLLSVDCADRPRVSLAGDPRLRAIVDEYGQRVRAAADEAEPYGFDQLRDGEPVTAPMRRAFRDALRDWERSEAGLVPLRQDREDPPPHPFDGGASAFVAWLAAPGSLLDAGAGLNRLLLALWAERTDLMVTFPRPCYGNGPGFRAWCRLHGVAEGLVPRWAAPVEPVEPAGPVAEFGVNLAGYLTAEFGLGEMGRVLHATLRAADVPTVAVVEERSLASLVRTGLAAPRDLAAPRFPISVLAVNADYTELLLTSHPQLGRDRYRIGFWAWELEDFPARFDVGFGLVDEVWANSDFARDAIARRASVPVKTFPVPVLDPGVPDRAPRQAGDPVSFLFAFDFNSTAGRKNPWDVIAAFQQAFPGRENARLVIKASNGHLHGAAAERLRYLAGVDHRIELVERYLSVAELARLYADCDAYVSLHRSEGFGLTVAEAMIRGIPVISTDYSATREFVDERAGWPIPCTLVEVGAGSPPYQPDGHWAQPDVAAAAAAMRVVAEDPAQARQRGAAAREHLLRTRSVAAAARWVREQLDAAYQSWQGAAPGAVDTVRLPVGPALRRVARRAIARNDALLDRLGSRMATSEGTDAVRLTAFRQALQRRGNHE